MLHAEAPPPEPIRLVERLRQAADLWVEANEGSLAQIGRLALGDSSFFSRPASPQGPTTATLEKFARFLGDAANWPEGSIPDAVAAFVHVTGVSPEGGEASSGKGDEISQGAAA